MVAVHADRDSRSFGQASPGRSGLSQQSREAAKGGSGQRDGRRPRPTATHARSGGEWALASLSGKEWARAKPRSRKERTGSGMVAGHPLSPHHRDLARARHAPHDPVTARPVHPARSAPLRLCERKTTGAHTSATRHSPASRHPAATQPLGVFASLREKTQRPKPQRLATARPAAIPRPLSPLAAWRLGESKMQPPRPQRSRGAAGERRKPAPTRVGHGRGHGQGHGALGGAFYGKMPRSWYAVLMASRAREYAAMRMFTPRSREKETTRW